MKLNKILCVFLCSGLLAGSVNMTAFAKETDEKYDYAKINDRISAVFGSDSEKSKTGISVDTIKKAYEDIRDNYLEKIRQSDNDETSDTSGQMEESLPQENSEEEFVLQADSTEFTWDRNSDTGITIQTNSDSKSFTVKKNGILYSSSLISNNLFTVKKNGILYSSSLISNNLLIDYGTIYLSNDFLKKLDDGENDITLILKEGNLDIIVNVTDNQTEIPVEDNQITAKETSFEWDKSDFIGIAVNTNSKSKNVAIAKDGEFFASDDDRGVYITFGRVGITAKILKKLDVGENTLTLTFDDGTLDITVNVTDKKHASDTAEITADKTEFTWDRNSSDSIVINTNSKSESISVRQSGKIFSTSDKENISISDGVVTMKPEFLNKLNDGENELKLIFDDGSITVKINVTGSVENSKNPSVSSRNSDSSSNIGILPATGNEGLTVGAVIALLSAGLSGILLSTKRKREK